MNAWLFDLDDTLLNYSGSVERCWDEACAAHCGPAGIDLEQFAKALARTRRWFWSDPARHRRERINMPLAWQHIAEFALKDMGVSNDGLAIHLSREYAIRRRESLDLFPESLKTLDRLRALGMPLGLVTNGDAAQQRDKIERFDLARHFDVIVIEGEFGVGKPDAAVYRHALAAIGVKPSEATMVGDHLEFDVDGAQRFGLTGIWIDRQGTGLGNSAVRPHRIVSSLSELVDTPAPGGFNPKIG
jgi:putative hydrolase of the HAD superfamily